MKFGNYNVSTSMKPRPEVVVDRAKVGDDGPRKDAGIGAITPISARPTAARPFEKPAPTGHISDPIRAKAQGPSCPGFPDP